MLNMEHPHSATVAGQAVNFTYPHATTLEDLAEMDGKTDPCSGKVLTEDLIVEIYNKGAKLYFRGPAVNKLAISEADRVANGEAWLKTDTDGYLESVKDGPKAHNLALNARIRADRA